MPTRTRHPNPAALAFILLLTLPALALDKDAIRPDLPKERAEWNSLVRRDAAGHLSSENRLKALKHACELPLDPSMAAAPLGSYVRSDVGPSVPSPLTFGGTAWQSMGPRPGTNPDYGNVSGRIDALAFHPKNPAIMLLGSATGGIWKSTDGGVTWKPVSDTAPALATSAIAYSRSNPSIVFAATGEADSADLEFKSSRSLGTYLGAGLLKSVDGGETWTRIDADLPANAILSRVLVHPTNPQLVAVGIYMVGDVATNACGTGGLYRSTDGGVHFTRTFTHHASDLAQDPNTPDVLYGAFGVLKTADDARNCPLPEAPSGVYRSTDFGATWSPSLVPTTAGATFQSPTGNIKLAVTSTNPARVYASVLDTNDEHTDGGIFRSTDGGATWAKRAVESTMCPDPLAPQCSYDHFITVSPDAPDTLYFGAVNLFRSTDGAATWTKLTDIYEGRGAIHPDQHVGLVRPGEPDTLYVGNDGGLYRTTDGGNTFQTLNDSLTLAQFNGVALHPSDRAFAFGGTQDNGNMRFVGALEWSDRTGSDGGFNLIKQDAPSVVLSANFYAYMSRSTDGGETFSEATPTALMDGSSPKEPMAFYPPAVAAPGAPGTVFFGAQRVWVSTDFGATRSAWTPRSPATITTGSIYALDVAGDGSGPVWAGTTRGEVFVSADGGVTFADRSAGLPGTIVTRVKIVSADGQVGYVTLGGFSGLPSRHVFRTNDGGKSWTNVSGDLPDVPVTAFAVDPTDPTDLFAGTDVGVFRSRDGGLAWATFNQGLPNVSVYGLTFHPATGDLVAATYGRGMFRVVPSGEAPPLIPTSGFSYAPGLPRPGESVAFRDQSAGGPTSYLWDFADGTTSTERSPRHVFAQSGGYRVALTVSNAAGSDTHATTLVVTEPAVRPVTLQVPVVLDVYGVPPTHFTSDLVAVNRSTVTSRVTIAFTTAPELPGNDGFLLEESLAAGHELRLPDVIAYLRDRGFSFPAPGSLVAGTLRVTFEDVSDPALVFVGSRTSTPNPNTARGGSFGLFFNGVTEAAASSASAAILGLREDAAFRTNLALVDVPSGSGPALLSIQFYDGDTGKPAGAPVSYQLRPGEWVQQLSLVGTGARNGYARVTKTGGGTNRFIAYGSLADGPRSGGGTGDGSILGADASAGLVPIVLYATSGPVVFTTELILANPTPAPATVTLAYTPSPQLRPGAPATATITLSAGQQIRRSDAIAYLRDELHLPLAAGTVNQGGTLDVTGAVAYARTFNANPDATVGGTFGLAYPAVGAAGRAKTEAWVYGLKQDGETRSNLAIADARVGNAAKVKYVVDVFDVSGGAVPRSTSTEELSGGEWRQLNSILAAAGISSGVVRVRPETGASDFVVYGILNDGATPDQRTSDGSYVAMSGVK